jgi:hypothetical protein
VHAGHDAEDESGNPKVGLHGMDLENAAAGTTALQV